MEPLCLQNRQEEARSYLAEVWAINDIPTYAQHDPSDMIASMMSAFKWMGVSDPGKIMKHMLTGNKIDSGPSAVFLNKWVCPVVRNRSAICPLNVNCFLCAVLSAVGSVQERVPGVCDAPVCA